MTAKPMSARCLRLVERYGRIGLTGVVVAAAVVLGSLGTLVGMAVAGFPAEWWPAAMIVAAVVGAVCAGVVSLPVIDMADALSTALRTLQVTSCTDEVTGLLNRRAFFERATHLDAAGTVVAMVDVDHFKRVNDRFGHAVGDQVLRLVGQALRDAAPDAAIGRIGGDEFAVCIRAVGLDDVGHALRAATASVDAGRAGRVSCMLGIARREADETIIECLHRADLQLIAAKEHRNAAALMPTG